MKLYDCPPRTVIDVHVDGVMHGTVFFDHIDGMYSFCKDAAGNIMHLQAWTEVEPVTDVTVLDRFKPVMYNTL